jgi:signal transduction histidine kinase
MRGGATSFAAGMLNPRSLAARAALLFVGVSALLLIEVLLGIQLGRRIESAGDELTLIDRRGQALLLATSKISDMLHDLSAAEAAPEMVTRADLAHIHTHLVGLTPIEAELHREGRETVGVGRLLELSSAIQMNLRPEAIEPFIHEARPVVEELSSKALQLLVNIDGARKTQARVTEAARREFGVLMLAVGLGGALAVAFASASFFARLIRDLRQMEGKAALISAGDYGSPLRADRKDELGLVMGAVNQLAASLEDRDRQLDELRLRFSHQEKMMALGTFATGMAHEIGNPIQAISALCEQITGSLASDSCQENIQANLLLVEVIAAQADRLSRTINEIRAFAYQGKTEPEPVDINDVVQTTANLMRFDPRFRRAAIKVDCRAAESVVSAVTDHLVQMVMNLLVNAADAVEGRDGHIIVTTADRPDAVEISVADSGTGMDPQVLEQACTPFFTTKARNRGTGMGLAICRSIIEEHHGTMHIASRPGEGTSVTLTIPRGELWTTRERGQPS